MSDKYNRNTRAGEVDSSKFHYMNVNHPHSDHLDMHETNRMTSFDKPTRQEWGSERLDNSNKVGHIELGS